MNTAFLIKCEKLLRAGAVDPHLWQDAPLCFPNPRLAAYAAVRAAQASYSAGKAPEDLLRDAFCTMREALGDFSTPPTSVNRGAIKAEPATDDEIAAAAQRYVDRLHYWPQKEYNYKVLALNGWRPPVAIQQPAPESESAALLQQAKPQQSAPDSDTEDEDMSLCLDCGIATGKRATWMCTPCKCGPAMCGTCRQQRALATSGWTRCPRCDQWARGFKRL